MTTNSIRKWALTKTPSITKQPQQAAANRWIHSDETLTNGQIPYLVKFLGNVQVDLPRGLSLVKESIRKLEFQEQLRRAEGEKIPRVELIISVEGVAIRDAKTKQELYQFPLHRISYCADERSDRKYFSFIAKIYEDSDRHECFVFIGDKSSEEITLTIGQAFDLAYRRYLNSSGRSAEMKTLMVAHKKIKALEQENKDLKQRLAKYEENNGPLSANSFENDINSIFHSSSSLGTNERDSTASSNSRSSSPSPWAVNATTGDDSSTRYSLANNPFDDDPSTAAAAIAAMTLKPPPSKPRSKNRSIRGSTGSCSEQPTSSNNSNQLDQFAGNETPAFNYAPNNTTNENSSTPKVNGTASLL